MKTGDRLFDALALLGWDLEVADDGTITARNDGSQVVGQLQPDGDSIAWEDSPMARQLIQQARILDLRARALRAKKEREQATMPTGIFMPGAEAL